MSRGLEFTIIVWQPDGDGLSVQVGQVQREIGSRLAPPLASLVAEITDAILGPKAPPRKRPRRIAKRIAQRRARLRYPSAIERARRE